MTKTAIDGKTGMLNQRFYQCLKDCLSGYRRMTASVKRRLTRMGFRVVEETYIKKLLRRACTMLHRVKNGQRL